MRKFLFGFVSGFWGAMMLAEWSGVNDEIRESRTRIEETLNWNSNNYNGRMS